MNPQGDLLHKGRDEDKPKSQFLNSILVLDLVGGGLFIGLTTKGVGGKEYKGAAP